MSKRKSRNFVPDVTQIAILKTLHRGGHLERDENGEFYLYNDTDEVMGHRNTAMRDLSIKGMISSIDKNIKEIGEIKVEFTVYRITSKGIVLLAQIDAEEERMEEQRAWEL